MDSKNLNSQKSSFQDKVILNDGKPFKLWLEFEETSPWEDLTNDFANVIVDTLDGKSYGINVWTFKYLQTAIQLEAQNQEEGKGAYIIPPDLFVKELTRDCLEHTIKELLAQGDLDKVLNTSITG